MRTKQVFKMLAMGFSLLSLSVTILSAQTVTTLASFNGLNGKNFAGGPSLTQGLDGNFYGASYYGGVNGYGTVFKVTPTGKLTTLYSFCSLSNCADGRYPYGTLLLGTNGNFYGTTQMGGNGNLAQCGSIGCGTVFKITPAGELTTLHSFCSAENCTEGMAPVAGLTLGPNGNFYGTTFQGGTGCGACGTVFEITPSGVLTTPHNFNFTDGSDPQINPVLANNGVFYGATAQGGPTNGGAVYAMNATGTFKVLFDIPLLNGQTQGVSPLSVGADGNMYGTTFAGGNGQGSIFKLAPTGAFTTLYDFCSQVCLDEAPSAGVIQASDGNLYGTAAGGSFNAGAIYQLTSDGKYTDLYSFCAQKGCPDGSGPGATLLQGTDGKLYGVTSTGGGAKCSCGTIYSLSVSLAPFVEPNPSFGRVGNTVAILGNNLTGTTSVSFNGVPATFTVVSDTFVKATVPSGATSGTIQVTTSSATLNSNVTFRVIR